MRTRITKKAWFGPKRWGWGWSPVSPEGWVVTIAFAVVGQVVNKNLSPRRQVLAIVALVAAFFGVILLTGDPPGSRRRGVTAGTEGVEPIAA
jgi:hypothetical protein